MKLRKEAGLTQLEAANLLGVRPETISSWENGKTAPSVTDIPKIALVYRCSVAQAVDAFTEVHQK